MAIAGLGQALNVVGQGLLQRAQFDWQEQRQANLERIQKEERDRNNQREDKRDAEAATYRTEDIARNEAHYADDKTFKEKTLANQTENMRADNSARQSQLGIAREGLSLQKEDSEFKKVAGAFDQTMSAVEASQKALQDALKMKGSVNPMTGEPINDPEFGATRKQAIDDAQSRLTDATARAAILHDQLSTRFSKYSQYFPNTYSSFDKTTASPANTSESQVPWSLLKRPTP